MKNVGVLLKLLYILFFTNIIRSELKMERLIPRVAAVHDISCVGRCSLTTIIPVLSCLGIQVCPLPTAILSTHLGGFKDVAFVDCTEHIDKFSKHWQSENIKFNCIYSGFLASEDQIGVVEKFIEDFAYSHPLVLIDPVMGDEGKLYSVYNEKMQEAMKGLIAKADVITPNYTEACFLLGKQYQDSVDNLQELESWLMELADFGPDKVVMTGIPFKGSSFLNIAYQKSTDEFWRIENNYIPARYPGTGDIFASVLLGCLLKGKSLPFAVDKAANFVAKAVELTYFAHTPKREGVLLESLLGELCVIK